eukprot:SAG11_NODE_29717_length_308_cov_0.602871_1_plen_35_part_01
MKAEQYRKPLLDAESAVALPGHSAANAAGGGGSVS